MDPFGTAELRSAVLSAWADSPTRFREDANAEEDLRLGGYADAWFVELAQNAADAARAAGVAGRVRVEVRDGELAIANIGAPLTPPGSRRSHRCARPPSATTSGPSAGSVSGSRPYSRSRTLRGC
ncbi:hypothetical protein BJF90_34590 [Pseudonocardia sp. CNS-004]|nr:hypothetical protein BJF90_34590 [Pseudonocardia sp. CNS-004]